MAYKKILTIFHDEILFERPEKRVKIDAPDLFVYIANRRLEQFEKR